MLSCASCGAMITPRHRRVQSEHYAETYTLTASVRTSPELHRYFRYPEYQYLVGRIASIVKPPARVLDVGCDHGFFLDDARRYGYAVTGVEPSVRAREYAQRIGLEVYPSLDHVTGRFSAITLWHVLEHIPDPYSTLILLRDMLESDGVIAIRVPNAGSIMAHIFRDRWIWFQSDQHVHHFHERTLRIVLERAGLHILTLEQRRPNNALTRRSYRLVNAVMHATMNIPGPSVRDRLARMYQNITGTELFVLCQKNA